MVELKSKKELEIMRDAGKILSETMYKIYENISEGISTKELDNIARKHIESVGAIPAFLGYPGGDNGFPGSICASINEVVVHGIPSYKRILKNGDIQKNIHVIFFNGS